MTSFRLKLKSHKMINSALKIFVNSAANPVRNHKFNHKNVQDDPLLHLLQLAVSKKVVSARQVCDALLASEHLRPQKVIFGWQPSDWYEKSLVVLITKASVKL